MRVVVIGAGIMGAGIAQCAATAGHETALHDVSAAQLEKARAAIGDSLDRFKRRERISAAEAESVWANLELSDDLDRSAAGAEVIVEAVPEKLQLKHAVLAAASSVAAADPLIATNTSQLSISEIANGLGEHESRVIGLHFFNPPVLMKLIEIILGIRTRPETLTAAQEFAASLGKETVVCRKDSAGFITTRAYAALRLECLRILDEGIATVAEIDKALRLGFNLPLGPLELADANGLDTNLSALEGLREAHGERFHPPASLKAMVAAGKLGRKTGAGFYDYSDS